MPRITREAWPDSLPTFGRSTLVLAMFIALSSGNQFLLMPFERAFTPRLQTVPAVVVAIPIFIVAAFHLAVWLVVSVCLAGWIQLRFSGEPLAGIRASMAVVAWCHLPHLVYATISLPLLVMVVRAFDGIVISPQSVAGRADALIPLKVIGAIRPWSWFMCLAMLVVTVAVHKRSARAGCVMVLPPVAVLLVLTYVMFALLPA
jgi:hypothetical protein